MQIDRTRVQEQFQSYTSGYDLADVKVRLKAEHTLRVAALCNRIAESLHMTDEEKDLAWLLGMLHDIGRFEQLRRFHTFRDGLSVDHAELGADLLFKENLIRRFVDIMPKEYDCRVLEGKGVGMEPEITNGALPGWERDQALIERAVRCHNKYMLPENLTRREYRFASLLRDADKIDILRVNIETPRGEIYDVPEALFLTASVTPSVLEDILHGRNIDRCTMRTPADLLLGHISFVFGLVYRESVRQVREQGYLEQLLHFPSENPATAAQFAQVRERIYAYMEQRLAYPSESR